MGSHKAVTRANAHAPGEVADFIDFTEVAAPATPATGFVRAYAKTDGLLYQKDDAGTETALSGSSSTFSGAHVYRSTTQSISNTTETAIAFDAEEFDTDTFHDNATNNSRLTAPSAGKYMVVYEAHWVGGGSGIRQARIKLNGLADYYARNTMDAITATASLTGSVLLDLSTSDYVEIMVYQDSGGSLNLESAADLKNRAQMYKVG